MIARPTAWQALYLLVPLVLAACAGVLGIKPRSPSHPFEHRAHAARGINCVTCHADAANTDLPSDDGCRRCHEKPHDPRPCKDCHGEAHARAEMEIARQRLRFDHRQHVSASRGDCVRCHAAIVDGNAGGPPDSVVPKMATCLGCHAHDGDWNARTCDRCHVDMRSEETPPSSHFAHDGDWLRRHGVAAASSRDLCASCHSERSCTTCHGVGTVPALPARLGFDRPRIDGLHRAGFMARHSDEARAQPGLCTSCHSESSCNGCHQAKHVGAGSGGKSPHPVGWVSAGGGGGGHGHEARVDPMSCASCHGGAGEQLCVSCHRVGGPGGNPHGRGFNSNKDAHHDRPCIACHGAGR